MTDPVALTTVYVPLDDLVLDARNPKDHDLGLVHASIGRFGYIEPVIVDDRTGKLVSGHGRTLTLRQMRDAGQDPPAGITVDGDGRWLVPSTSGWSSRSDEEASAALVALNRSVEAGGWNMDALTGILSELAEGAGLDGVGYDAEDLDRLLEDLAGVADGFDSGGDDEHSPTGDEVTVFSFGVFQFGMYRFEVPVTEYTDWLEAIRQRVGFEKEQIVTEVKTMLTLPSAKDI